MNTKKKVILMMGLPASGKSTRAAELAQERGYRVISRDKIRQKLWNGQYSPEKEKAVKEEQEKLLIETLHDPEFSSVIIDDAGNLNFSTQQLIQTWVKESGVETEVIFDKTCLEVPVSECIKRDNKRPNGVGESVIRKFASRYLPKPQLPESVKSLPKCIVLDVDSCLAIMGDRLPYEYEKAGEDKINWFLLEAVNGLTREDRLFIVVTGREESKESRQILKNWLREFCNCANIPSLSIKQIIMRPEGDRSSAVDFKRKLIHEIMQSYHPVLAIDDDPEVIQVYVDLGIQTWGVYNA